MPRSALLSSVAACASRETPGPHVPRFDAVADVATRRLHVGGEFDVAVVDHFAAVAAILATGQPGDVVLDLGSTTFIDASGLGAVVRLRNLLTAAGHVLRLEGVPAAARRVFTVAGLAELLPAAD